MLTQWFESPYRLAATLLSLVGLAFCRSWPKHRASRDLPLDLPRIFNQFREGFAMVDQRSVIVFANESFGEIVGQSAGDLMGQSIDQLPWLHASNGSHPWRDVLPNRSPAGDELVAYQHPDGRHRLFCITTNRVQLDPASEAVVILTLRDATGREQVRAERENLFAQVQFSRQQLQLRQEKLQALVDEDGLTGCQNRRALADKGEIMWATHRSARTSLACVMFDIDHFKAINDTHGHAVGDAVLVRVAATLRETFAGVGQVFRYGGEEFCVLLPRHDLAEAGWIAERVRSAIEQLSIDSESSVSPEICPTVSVGVVDGQFDAASLDELIAQADKCLYIAKRRGRNQVVRYDHQVASASIRRSDR